MHEHGPRPRSCAHARAHACAHAYAHAGAHAQRTRNAHATHTHHVHRTRNTHAHARTHTRAHTHTRTRTQPRPRPQTHTQTPHGRRALNEITAAGLETRRPRPEVGGYAFIAKQPDSFRIHPDPFGAASGGGVEARSPDSSGWAERQARPSAAQPPPPPAASSPLMCWGSKCCGCGEGAPSFLSGPMGRPCRVTTLYLGGSA